MKIIVVGATGTLGSAVVSALQPNHEIIGASRNGDLQVDLSIPDTIKQMYQAVSGIDAVVCAAGGAVFGPLDSLSGDDFAFGLGSKLMGQVNLVRYGREHVKPGGAFTLTTGMLAHNPNAGAPMLCMINRGLEAFVESAALDMPHNQRLNAVCPSMAKETAIKMGWGADGLTAAEIAQYFVQSVESEKSGALFGPGH